MLCVDVEEQPVVRMESLGYSTAIRTKSQN